MKRIRAKRLGILVASVATAVLLIFFAQSIDANKECLNPVLVVEPSSHTDVPNVSKDKTSDGDLAAEPRQENDVLAQDVSVAEAGNNEDSATKQSDANQHEDEHSSAVDNPKNLSEENSDSSAAQDIDDAQEAQDGLEQVQGEQVEQALAVQPSSSDKHFVMPEHADYDSEEVLIEVNPSASVEEVEQALEGIEGIASQSVSADDVRVGLVSAKLEQGTSVEDAVNAVLSEGSEVVEGSQPNYVYQLSGLSAMDLRAQLDTVESLALEAQEAEDSLDEVEEGSDFAAEETQESAQDAQEEQEAASEEAASEQAEQEAEQEEESSVMSAEEELDSTDDDAEDGEEAPASEDGEQSDDENDADQQNVLDLAATSINDPRKSELWALTSMRAYEAWDYAKTEQAVSVAVVDDGVNISHPDLAANIVEGSCYNAVTGDTDVSPITNHGTHVAGIVSAVANNGEGVAGVSYNAGIVPVQVFSGSNAYTSNIVKAIEYVIENADEYNIKVINLSLGTYIENDDFEDYSLIRIIRKARKAGIVTVAAAGNNTYTLDSDGNTVTVYPPYYAYPADSASIVSVINLKSGGSYKDASGKYAVVRHTSSNYNVDGQGGTSTYKGKNISAPGSSILNTYYSGYSSLTGTSMSSPQVAGIVALEFAARPSLGADEAVDNLYSTAYDIGDSGWDSEYGYGEVNAYAAVVGIMGTVDVETDATSFVYTGEVQRPSVKISKDGVELVEGSDYELVYSCEESTEVGSYTITVNWKGEHANRQTRTIGYEITACDISGLEPVIEQDSYEYDCRAITPSIQIAYNGMELEEGADYTRSDTSNTNVGEATIALVGKDNYTGRRVLNYTIERRNLASDSIVMELDQSSFEYMGTECKPNVVVTHTPCVEGQTPTYLDPVTLVEGTDYSVSYKNCNAAGTAVATITGEGNYTGTASKEYELTKPIITSDDVTLLSTTCTKGEVPEVEVTHDGIALVKDTDYAISYTNVYVLGEATITVSGKGIYGGTVTKTFTITERSLDDAEVSLVGGDNYTYSGSAITPTVTVTYNGVVLSEDEYDVGYTNNVNAGTATVSVFAVGATYGGTNEKSFTIAAATINKGDVTLEADSFTYTGSAIKPGVAVQVNSVELKQGSDYTVTYANNKIKGTAKATIVGKGNYSGTVVKEFQIEARPIADAVITVSDTTYTGDVAKPTVRVEYGGKTLAEGTDYATTCASTNAGEGTVTVEGKGNFGGTTDKTFTIARQKTSVPSATNHVYTGKKQTGLAADAKYTLTGTPSAINAGAYTVYATPAANYAWSDGTTTKKGISWKITAASITSVAAAGKTFTGSAIKPKPTVKAGSLTVPISGYTVTYSDNTNAGTAKVKVVGKGNYTGTKTTTFKIAAASIATTKVASVSSQAYTGKSISPSPKITYNNKTLVKGSDYTLSYSNNQNVGTAAVTIRGKGNYSGTRKATFKIVAPSIMYKVHVQSYGWQAWKYNGELSGTSGESKRLEGIYIKLKSGFVVSGGVSYRTHVQTYGWQEWSSNGALSGTTGESKRLEAIQIKLTGNMAKKYDVYYCVHAQTFGWMGWAKNGEDAGTAGYSKRLEAIKIRLVPKGQPAPGSTENAFRQR